MTYQEIKVKSIDDLSGQKWEAIFSKHLGKSVNYIYTFELIEGLRSTNDLSNSLFAFVNIEFCN